MVVFPNAKINIGLNVIEKRKDGFHNIESVFYPIQHLFDVLEIVENEQLIFNSTGINIPGDVNSNLCIMAFQLIKNDFDIPNVKIHLHKVIPIGAGLGGGSSDAAFMLIGLNKLFKLNISDKQLIYYAQQLGSDCAFFIVNKPVYAFNKGDEFETIELDLSNFNIKIEYPNVHIGTAEAYNGIIPQVLEHHLKQTIKTPIHQWKSLISNNFELSVFPKYSIIKELKEKMYLDGAVYSSMTGSGSAVFGIFEK